MPKRFWLFWAAGLLSAWLADFLFTNHAPGISVVIWAILLSSAGIAVIRTEGRWFSWRNIPLILLVLGFAFTTTWRSEPFTAVLAGLLMISAFFILAYSYQEGHWWNFRVQDHISAWLRLAGDMFTRGFGIRPAANTPPAIPDTTRQKKGKIVWAVIKGILIALPILAVLIALLVSADPIFEKLLAEVFDITRLPEYTIRLIFIIVFGFLLTGAFLHAALPRKPETKPDLEKNWVKPFLGSIESIVVLGLVDLLFIVFVGVQARYLFGAASNINAQGFTYAEYARRGFFELAAVAVISLTIYLCLSTISKRETRRQRSSFSVASILLLALVLVILASSLMRLTLYEEAYGFTRLRTYTHVFIFTLAVLLAATIIFEIVRWQHRFALALVLTLFGFGIALAILNVDGFIVNKNIERTLAGMQLDTEYISTLSHDAVPQIIKGFHNTKLGEANQAALGANLACRLSELESSAEGWQSWRSGDANKLAMLRELRSELVEYPIRIEEYDLKVKVNGEWQSCQPYIGWMD